MENYPFKVVPLAQRTQTSSDELFDSFIPDQQPTYGSFQPFGQQQTPIEKCQ